MRRSMNHMMKSAGKKSCEVKGEQAPRKRVFLAGSRPYCRKGREFLMNEERFTDFFCTFHLHRSIAGRFPRCLGVVAPASERGAAFFLLVPCVPGR